MARPADRDQMVQVIQNLAENALKYAPAGIVGRRRGAWPTSRPTRRWRRASPGAAHLSLLTPDHAADQRYVAAARRATAGPASPASTCRA